MPRLRYATPEDVARRAFGATVARAGQNTIAAAIDNDALLGTEDDREYFTARLEAVESKWDREATPMRAVRVGSADAPKKFDAKGSPWPVRIYLDHENIRPFDAASGDFIETRTARDKYTDITGQEGSAWTADYDRGIITVYRLPGAGQLPAFHRVKDEFVRISYHIAAGGDIFSAGETTLGEDLTDTDTGTISVADASRLPPGAETLLVGGSEYIHVSSTDRSADTIEIESRGERFTDAAAHAPGDAVHFCPLDVRGAVAGLTAAEVLQTEDYTEAAFDGNIDRDAKMEDWQNEWNRAVNSYSTAAGYE